MVLDAIAVWSCLDYSFDQESAGPALVDLCCYVATTKRGPSLSHIITVTHHQLGTVNHTFSVSVDIIYISKLQKGHTMLGGVFLRFSLASILYHTDIAD